MMKQPTLFLDDDDEIEADDSNAGTMTQEPIPYHNRTLPSRAAAESARAFVRSQAVRISEYIASQGDHGASDREIQIALTMDGNSQRPRRVWLRDNGFIQAKSGPEDIVLRDGSTVWISVRPLGLVTTRAPQEKAAATDSN